MSDTVKVRPRPGIILAGIPASGADVGRALAKEWLAAGLVFVLDESKPEPTKPAKDKTAK